MSRAESAVTLILACRKELPLLLRATAWDAAGKNRGRLLHGAVVHLAGVDTQSNVADMVALLEPMGARIVRGGAVSVAQASVTDVLVLLPGAALIGSDELAALPEDATVVDACAPVAPAVDPDVLASWLIEGRLRYVGLFVSDDPQSAHVPAGHALWDSAAAILFPVALADGLTRAP